MSVNFFSKCSPIHEDFRYAVKNKQGKCFLETCSWIGCGNFFLLQAVELVGVSSSYYKETTCHQ